jgi:hypothetical protein
VRRESIVIKEQPQMSRTIARNVLLAIATIGVAGWMTGANPLLSGQDARAKKAHRLPPYYADIVTETQRIQIYAVQDKYAEQIAALTEQLNALQEERDAEIEALLNADQKERLKKAKEDGAARRKKTAADKKA